jgi:nucleotide-binding universal stress UspA family protein
MYKRILVPLDGSTFSESVLPHVRMLADSTGAEVILLRVMPVGIYDTVFASTAELPMPRNPEEDTRAQAEGYLQRVAFDYFPPEVTVRLEVSSGATPETILDYAEGENADLIAMTTHGRSGISRLMVGSVAEEIVRRAHVPVMLVRPS